MQKEREREREKAAEQLEKPPERLFVGFSWAPALMPRSEAQIYSVCSSRQNTQQEGRKRPILHTPIVWPPGLSNQTAMCRERKREREMDEVLGGGREREPMVCVPSWSLYLSLAVGGFPISSQSQSVCVLKCVLNLIKDYTGFAHILNLGMDTCFTQVCRHCTCAQYRGFASASVIVKLKASQFYKIVIVPPVV